MTITLDGLAQALINPECPKGIVKSGTAPKGAGAWQSLWKAPGYPAAGANPPIFTAGSGYIPLRTTTGAIGQTNPGGSNNKYVASFSSNATVAGQLIVYDRLWACSGINSTTVSAQTVTTPGTLTTGRDPYNGFDVEPWIEIYTITGATGSTWTLTGTDSTGTTGRTWTYVHAAVPVAGQMYPMVPGTAVGGCRVATSLTIGTSTGTAGDVGITLLRRLGTVSVSVPNIEAAKDAFALGLPEVYDDACLAFMQQATAATATVWMAQMSLAEMTP